MNGVDRKYLKIVDFFLRLNSRGKNILNSPIPVPSTFWERLAHEYRPPDVLYFLLRERVGLLTESSNKRLKRSDGTPATYSGRHQINRTPFETARQSPRVNKRSTVVYPTGTIIRKKFDDGWFEGEVTEYDPVAGYYKINYTDGDQEELDAKEVRKYFKKSQQYSKKNCSRP